MGDVLTAATGRRWDEPLGLPQSIGRHEGVMTSEEQLKARLRKIEALFAGAAHANHGPARGGAANCQERRTAIQHSRPLVTAPVPRLLGVTVCARIATHAGAGPR